MRCYSAHAPELEIEIDVDIKNFYDLSIAALLTPEIISQVEIF